MKNDLTKLIYQIDVFTDEVEKKNDLLTWLHDHSLGHEEFMDSGLTRWHFQNFGHAVLALVNINMNEILSYRLICLATDSLYVQVGSFVDPVID